MKQDWGRAGQSNGNYKRYLITGGAGFIGSHLAECLLGQGHSVTVLDDFSTGRIENVKFLMDNPKFRLCRDSAENRAAVDSLMGECDAVFHLAATLGVQLVVEQPVRAIRTTIHATEVVVESAYRFGRPILLTSSSEVYGKGSRVPFREDDDVVMGATRFSRWCYAYSKGIGEFLALAYHHQYGLPAVVVRLFNTVGPRQVGTYGMVLPRFVQAAMQNQPIQIYGDGTQTRCFCHVSDSVSAIVRLLQMPAAAGQVYNVGSDQEISIQDLARRVIELTHSSSAIEYVTYAKAYGDGFDDLPRRVPDLGRIRDAIAYRPTYTLDQIILSIIEGQRALMQSPARVAGT